MSALRERASRLELPASITITITITITNYDYEYEHDTNFALFPPIPYLLSPISYLLSPISSLSLRPGGHGMNALVRATYSR